MPFLASSQEAHHVNCNRMLSGRQDHTAVTSCWPVAKCSDVFLHWHYLSVIKFILL